VPVSKSLFLAWSSFMPDRSVRQWPGIIVAMLLLSLSVPAVEAQTGAVSSGTSAISSPRSVLQPPTLKIMALMTLLSLAPSILIMTTSFIRFVIVFGLLRQALGTQQLPPTQVLTSLSLFMTMFVMMPVWQQAYEEGLAPYIDKQPIPNLQPGENVQKRVFENTIGPIRRFMSHQIHSTNGDDAVWMLIDYRRPNPESLAGQAWTEPESLDDVDSSILVTAFMLTELKAAFLIGFQIFLPFLIVDLVVATVLTGMGMMMLPPTLISLPFKVLLFVLIDGWALTVEMLLQSVTAAVS
jgi:flagellar biosynthesis protein FliP